MAKKKLNRRSFLTKAGLGGAAIAAPGLIVGKDRIQTQRIARTERPAHSYSPSDTIQIALIGAGGMGGLDTDTALQVPGVEIVAACDLYDGRLSAAKERYGDHLVTTRDYREILQREDVDAVIIATPDHFHQEISSAALMAGKSVYCEKPMVHSLDEGPLVIQSQSDSRKIFQVGSQGMSSLGNEKARELLAAGAIGELNYAEGFWARNSPQGAWQYKIPDDGSPETVDWETFLRNGPEREWDPLRFFRWRNYRDYGTGVSGDLFVHLFSSLHFITGSIGPERIYASGGLRFWKDGREVPDVMLGVFDYPETAEHPGFNLSLRVNFVDGTSGTTYLRLVGSEGAMDVEWRKVTLYKNKKQEAKDPFLQGKMAEMTGGYKRAGMLPPPKVIYEVEEDYKGAHFDHLYKFFEGVRTDNPVAEDAVFGYRAAAPALACNMSYFEDRVVRWDPSTMGVSE